MSYYQSHVGNTTRRLYRVFYQHSSWSQLCCQARSNGQHVSTRSLKNPWCPAATVVGTSSIMFYTTAWNIGWLQLVGCHIGSTIWLYHTNIDWSMLYHLFELVASISYSVCQEFRLMDFSPVIIFVLRLSTLQREGRQGALRDHFSSPGWVQIRCYDMELYYSHFWGVSQSSTR